MLIDSISTFSTNKAYEGTLELISNTYTGFESMPGLYRVQVKETKPDQTIIHTIDIEVIESPFLIDDESVKPDDLLLILISSVCLVLISSIFIFIIMNKRK